MSMNGQSLPEIIEKNRQYLHQLARENSLNFQAPSDIEASEYMDQLLNDLSYNRQNTN